MYVVENVSVVTTGYHITHSLQEHTQGLTFPTWSITVMFNYWKHFSLQSKSDSKCNTFQFQSTAAYTISQTIRIVKILKMANYCMLVYKALSS